MGPFVTANAANKWATHKHMHGNSSNLVYSYKYLGKPAQVLRVAHQAGISHTNLAIMHKAGPTMDTCLSKPTVHDSENHKDSKSLP